MNFPFLLVILGQPDFTDKDFRLTPQHSRRVKNVYVHPNYRGQQKFSAKKPNKEQMPIFDFALIEVKRAMYKGHHHYSNFKFEPMVRPVCLPSERMWKSEFLNQITTVSGYGRIEAIKISGRDQNSKQLKQAHLRITGKNNKKCEKVMFSYITIKALDCLVGRM